MTERKPVDSVLEPALDEAGVARVWRRLGERRAARARTRGARLLVGAGLAAGAVAAAVVAAIALRAPEARPLAARADLSIAPGASLVAPADTAVPLDDGSTVTLARGAKVDVLTNDGDRFVTLLRRGRASYEVKPGGPRRWVVETDLATIEVVGTGFEVDRDDRRGLTVTVRHGVVMVRGERVPGRVQRLVAGAHLTVAPPAVQTSAAEPPAPPPAAVEVAPAPPPVVAPSRHRIDDMPTERPSPSRDVPRPAEPSPLPSRADAPRPAEPSPSGDVPRPAEPSPSPPPPRADATPPAEPPPPAAPPVAEPPSLREAVAAADRLRRAGRAREAAELLERSLASAPDDPMAGVAAFSLGRLQLDILHQPARAAASFALVIRVGPRTLVEDAHVRRVAALLAAGRRDEARAAARAYAAAFPDGERADQVRALLGEP